MFAIIQQLDIYIYIHLFILHVIKSFYIVLEYEYVNELQRKLFHIVTDAYMIN